MQIWDFPFVFVFIRQQCTENFAFLILWILEFFTGKVCKMFVYKHTEIIEYVKSSLLFKKNSNFMGK